MRIIICGAGQVGTSIAQHLANEGNDITIVDSSAELIQKINDTLDVKAIVGFASHPPILMDLGAEDADMIIAVTPSDEVNMIICQIAHTLFNVPTKIARIRHENYLTPEWRHLYRHDHLPIDVIISPEVEVARAINHRLHTPGAFDTIPFAAGKLKVVAVKCSLDCPLVHMSMTKVMQQLEGKNAAIMGIVRQDELIIPRPNEQIEPADDIYIAIDNDFLYQVISLFGYDSTELRNFVIIGGGNVGLYLAQLLQEDPDIKVRIIEISTERAKFVAEKIEHGSVINGDALEQEILDEADIGASETVIAITHDDEVNILSSLRAKNSGCGRAITLVNKGTSYSALITSLGIDVVINPKEITVSRILQHVRRGRIHSVRSLAGGQGEIIETEVAKTSPVIGRKVKELDLPEKAVLGVIVRNNEIIIPDDSTTLVAEDRIILLCTAKTVRKIERIFPVKYEVF